MSNLKEVAGLSGNKKTQKNLVINYLSLLFIRSEKRPCYVVINQTDWNYLISLPGITEYLDINYLKEHSDKGMLGSLWSATILLVNETKEVKVYHEDTVHNMKKRFS